MYVMSTRVQRFTVLDVLLHSNINCFVCVFTPARVRTGPEEMEEGYGVHYGKIHEWRTAK
jgi:hypothetical protein